MASVAGVRPSKSLRAPFSSPAARPIRARVQCNAAASGLMLKVKLKAYDHPELDEACGIIRTLADDNGATMSGPVPLPTKRRIYCVLRSPHVNSNSREHFEIRTHQRLLHVKDVTREMVMALTELALPAGVDVSIRT